MPKTQRSPPSSLSKSPDQHGSDPHTTKDLNTKDRGDNLSISKRFKPNTNKNQQSPGKSDAPVEDKIEELRASNEKRFDILAKSLEILIEQNSEIKNSLDCMSTKYESLLNKVDSLQKENTLLKENITDLNSRISRMEQHSRLNNLEIQNIPENKSENLVKIVKQIATITDCKLEESDIQVCTRIAKINKDSQRPRSIVVKFTSQISRDNFLASTLKFNKKTKILTDKLNTDHLGIGGGRKPVYIVEHLSPAQKALHAAARSRAKELQYKFVWVKGGKIFMRKTDTSEYKLIKNTQDLSELD